MILTEEEFLKNENPVMAAFGPFSFKKNGLKTWL